MRERRRKVWSWTAFLGGIVLLAAAIWLDESVPNWVNGLLCGFGGAALGAGAPVWLWAGSPGACPPRSVRR